MRRSRPPTRDVELLARVARADRAAFSEFYDRHRTIAYSVARRVCGGRDLADDSVQEAFCAVWRDARTYRASAGTPEAWLLTIVRNRSIDCMRRRAVIERRRAFGEDLLELIPESGPPPEQFLDDGERNGLVHSAISRLSPSQHEVVQLAYFKGLTHREIATQLDLPLGTVKGRLRLALRRLAEAPDLVAFAPETPATGA